MLETGPKISYYGISLISLFFKANDSFALGPVSFEKNMRTKIEKRLNVPFIPVGVDMSDLVGLFTAMNNTGMIVSNMFSENEIKVITSCAKNKDVNVYVSSDVHNANGNNICANSNGGIINPDISSNEIKMMSDVLNVELVPMSLVGFKTVGSACLATDKGFMCHNDISPEQIKELEAIFKVKGVNTTINLGLPLVGTGVVANSFGYVIGSESTGVEIQRVEDGLDFLT